MSELKLNDYQQMMYDEYVDDTYGQRMGEKTTVVVLKLKNGFEVVGSSGCVNPADFVYEIGYHYALVDALKKLDELVGFLRQERAFSSTTVTINNYIDSDDSVTRAREVIEKTMNMIKTHDFKYRGKEK